MLSSTAEIETALHSNRNAAVVCAGLLLGPGGFTKEELFMKIASLSFMGLYNAHHNLASVACKAVQCFCKSISRGLHRLLSICYRRLSNGDRRR